ncbi:MAG: 1,4-dihydroxy-2-naphthoate polyprenyltransferase [Actinomycetota bacterium]
MSGDAGGTGGVSAAPTVPSLTLWWRGARPRTLGAGLVPVVLGTAAADAVIWWRLVAALLVAAGLQIGVNLVNDYFDGVRGVDTHRRLGPPRLTASGVASPRAVLVAALIALGVAAVAGLALALATEPVLILAVGAFALIAALLYSGGPRPYAGLGLGELMVFLFFGLMATCGTAFVMEETVPAAAWWGGAVMGWLAVAILVANNLRDIPTDAESGKRTLAVRIGDRATRRLYRATVVAAFATVALGVIVDIVDEGAGLPQWALFGLGAWVLAIKPMEAVGSATGRDLIPVLTGTAATHAASGLLIALGLILANVDQAADHVVPLMSAILGGR